MKTVYIFGEINSRGVVNQVKFKLDFDYLIDFLEKHKTTDEDDLYDIIHDEFDFGQSMVIYALFKNDFLNTSNVQRNIDKIKTDQPILIELEEAIFGIADSKERAFLTFHSINDIDW